MRFSPFISAASLLAGAALVAASDDSDVLNLVSKNFLSTVNKEELMLVEFFAPWYVCLSFYACSNGPKYRCAGAVIAKPSHQSTRRLRPP